MDGSIHLLIHSFTDLSFLLSLHPQSCPHDFTSAAGGPCAPHSGLSEVCPGGGISGASSTLFHNGDVDGDSQLTILDVDAIAAFIIDMKDFTECQKYKADGELRRVEALERRPEEKEQ